MDNLNIFNNNILNITSKKACICNGGCFFSIDKNELISHTDKVKASSDKTEDEYGIAVFDINNKKLLEKYPFDCNEYSGDILVKYIEGFNTEEWCYTFYCNDMLVTDVRADRYVNVPEYGKLDNKALLYAAFDSAFDYSGDIKPVISYEDAFVYQMHVRGFTKHSSSGTKYKGTFKGIEDKLPYLTDLGVTTIEMQPINEFCECDDKTQRLNYWGYCKGYYYTPKAAYSSSQDASTEFYNLVKTVHNNGIEIVLQMYFPSDFSPIEVVKILEYWTVKYHIDGFRILSEKLSMDLVEASAILSESKIWCDRFDGIDSYRLNDIFAKKAKHIALYRDDYLYSLRKFLKADEFSITDAIAKIRENPLNYGIINYFGSFNTMTLYDSVSYERKHNEDNGEENRDGSDYNCTWNCGEEGATRKPRIIALRRKQIKNALMMLMLSSGTPMIYMGDEFGRTQLGNNNPYCLDSKITWLDWSCLKKQNNLKVYISYLLKLRAEYKVFHASKELTMLDVSGCGYPELSYHAESAWISHPDGYKHSIGIMYCDNGKLLYIAMNMHWNSAELSLPRPPKGSSWTLLLSTDDALKLEESMPSLDLRVTIPEHTINLYTITDNKATEKDNIK